MYYCKIDMSGFQTVYSCLKYYNPWRFGHHCWRNVEQYSYIWIACVLYIPINTYKVSKNTKLDKEYHKKSKVYTVCIQTERWELKGRANITCNRWSTSRKQNRHWTWELEGEKQILGLIIGQHGLSSVK